MIAMNFFLLLLQMQCLACKVAGVGKRTLVHEISVCLLLISLMLALTHVSNVYYSRTGTHSNSMED